MENASYSFVNLGSIKGFNDILCEQNIDGSCSSSNILKLNKIDCRTENNQKYKIIKYDKSILNNDLINSYGLCRSVIINSKNSTNSKNSKNNNGINISILNKNKYEILFDIENPYIILTKLVNFNLAQIIYEVNKDIISDLKIDLKDENEATLYVLLKHFFELFF